MSIFFKKGLYIQVKADCYFIMPEWQVLANNNHNHQFILIYINLQKKVTVPGYQYLILSSGQGIKQGR